MVEAVSQDYMKNFDFVILTTFINVQGLLTVGSNINVIIS